MKGKRYTTEQKIRMLREAQQSDATVVGVCRAHQISEQTFHRPRKLAERIRRDEDRPGQAAQGVEA